MNSLALRFSIVWLAMSILGAAAVEDPTQAAKNGAKRPEPIPAVHKKDIHVGKDVKTIREAIKMALPGDTIHLEPIVYRDYAGFYGKKGEPGKPITFDGHGATLEGSDPLDPDQWKEVGPGLFANDHVLPHMDDAILMRWFFLWDGKMNLMGRTSKGKKAPFKKPEELQADDWTYVQDKANPKASKNEMFGTFYIKLPAGKTLGEAKIAVPVRSAGVQLSGDSAHLIIKNVTATHPYNDGFNIHGDCRDVVFENIRAIDCGDDGVSAHESAEYRVDGLVSIGNSTGITDTVAAHTSYNHVFIAGCHAFDLYFLNNGRYKVQNCVVLSSSGYPLSLSANKAEHTELSLDNVLIRCVGKPEQGRAGKDTRLQASGVTFENMTFTTLGDASFVNSIVNEQPLPEGTKATGAARAKLINELVPAEYQAQFANP